MGKSFNYLNIYKEYGFQPYKIIREDEELIYNLNSAIIHKDDVIIGQIQLEEIIRFKEELNVLLLSDVKMNQNELTGQNFILVEGLFPINRISLVKLLMIMILNKNFHLCFSNQKTKRFIKRKDSSYKIKIF